MSEPFSPKFYIETLRIGTVEGASAVNLGNNTPSHFENHSKHNQGFGTVSGDKSKVSGTKSALIEEAIDDLFANQNEDSHELAQWLKEFLSDKETVENDQEDLDHEEEKVTVVDEDHKEHSIDEFPYGEFDVENGQWKINIEKDEE